MFDAELWLPVLFERIHANLAIRGHIRMLNNNNTNESAYEVIWEGIRTHENLCDEVSLRWLHGKALAQDELDPEAATLVGRIRRAVDVRLDVGDVLLVWDQSHAV